MKKFSLKTIVFVIIVVAFLPFLFMIPSLSRLPFGGLIGSIPVFAFLFFIVVFGLFFYISGRFLKGDNKKKQHLLDIGKRAKATIVDLQDTGVSMGTIQYFVQLTLDVKPSGDSPFKAQITAQVSRVDLPRRGDEVEVIYDPANKQDMMLLKDCVVQ